MRKRTLETPDIIELYLDGMNTTEIAEKANVSSRYIRMLLNKNDVPIGLIGSWKREYTVNENYFKTWSNNMPYIFRGYFDGDGYVNCKKYTVT